MKQELQELFTKPIFLSGNRIFFDELLAKDRLNHNQEQTKDIFSIKWEAVSKFDKLEETFEFQKKWFLELYGFNTIDNLVEFLKDKKVIVDYGSGLGYKSAWFAELAPHAIVIGVEISDSIEYACERYEQYENLLFFKGDIANTGLKNDVVEFSICDQVIMHTEVPEKTFKHIAEVTSKNNGVFGCYVYAKKAVPRELIDDYFRMQTHKIADANMWEFSKQLTTLGKNLADLNVKFVCPDIPLLNIKGGEYDIQRFIYWNFLKCFWNEGLGYEVSYGTNYDWYAPSNAKRYSKEEFLKMVEDNNLKVAFFHEEEACYSGRFRK